jgi:hypothetical protein
VCHAALIFAGVSCVCGAVYTQTHGCMHGLNIVKR